MRQDVAWKLLDITLVEPTMTSEEHDPELEKFLASRDPKATCPDCESEMRPITLIDTGDHNVHKKLGYAIGALPSVGDPASKRRRGQAYRDALDVRPPTQNFDLRCRIVLADRLRFSENAQPFRDAAEPVLRAPP